MIKSRNSKLLLGLAIIVFLIVGYPLFYYGIDRSFFYVSDPDIVYITNALLYTKYHIILYIDHPGTPTIMLTYYLFIPLRLIAKYILHEGFIQWSFDNFALLTYYLRIFQLLLFSGSLFIFLKLIKSMSDSLFVTIFALLSAISFLGIGYAITVNPENLSLFLAVVWLAFFVKFVKTRRYYLNVILVFIAGIAFANKFTNGLLFILSVLLPIFVTRAKLSQRIVMMEANLTIFAQAFLVGVWPIRNNLKGIYDWANFILAHGGIHGTGNMSFFNWPIYSESVMRLLNTQPATFLFVLFTIGLGIYLLAKKQMKFTDPFAFLMGLALIGFSVFIKYPLMYYNNINLLLLIFCACYFLTKVRVSVVKVLVPIMVIVTSLTTWNYLTAAFNRIEAGSSDSVITTLENWTPYWAGDIFREQLDALKKP